MKMKLLFAVTLLAAAATQAQANPLPPGATSIPPDSYSTNPLSGENLLAHVSSTFTGTMGIDAGTYDAWVYQDTTTGYLDFAYQFSVTKGKVERTSHFDFTGTTIYDAGYYAENSTEKAPSEMSRTSDGSVAGFGFLGSNVVNMGGTSTIQILRTMSKGYTSGLFTFQDGDTATVSAFAPTPEPGTLALALAALPILGLYRLRKGRKQA